MLRKKSPVTRPGIDSGTFRLVAQRLNHYAHKYVLNSLKKKHFRIGSYKTQGHIDTLSVVSVSLFLTL